MTAMLLNCDLGESFGLWSIGQDQEVMACIDQANIACGFHAGDPKVMMSTLQLAKQHNVQIGAHPGYPDLVGFGRRSMDCSSEEITAFVLYQISALDGMAKSIGLNMEYVKPHGALYNDMMKKADVREAIFKALKQFYRPIKLMVQSTPANETLIKEASVFNVPLLFELFADRAYLANGLLVPRSEANAVHNLEQTLKQIRQLKNSGTLTCIDGSKLTLKADSICVHGDNQHAVTSIKKIRELLQQ